MPDQPHPVDLHVGARVRQRRMLVGMSQEQLGRKLGLTFQQVQKYEKGANRISASRLAEIASVLSTAPTYFFDAMPDANGVAPGGEESSGDMEGFLSSSDGLRLNRAFNRIEDPSAKRGTRLVGDVDFDAVKEVAGAITPVPGGVGVMTVAMLLRNTLQAWEQNVGLA